MRNANYAEHLLRISSPMEYMRRDEEKLEHYKVLRELKKEAELSRHIPNSLDVETFNRAECNFIKDYFFGDSKFYNEWVKENEKYFD